MRDEIEEERMKELVAARGIDIVGVVETWRGKSERVRAELAVGQEGEAARLVGGERWWEPEEHRDLLGEGLEWYERCRKVGRRGGVGIGIRKGLGKVEVMQEWCCDAALWLRVVNGKRELYVCVVYVVPMSSAYSGERVEALAALSRGLFQVVGKEVVILLDANGRIGSRGIEAQVGDEVVRVERESADEVVNTQGLEVLGLLESYGMVVMNGVGGRESGRSTCRDRSVVDWVAVSEQMRAQCTKVVVEEAWESGKKVDHMLVRIDWAGWEGEQGEGREEGGGEAKQKKIVRRWSVRKGWQDGWVKLKRASEVVMRAWCERGKFKTKDRVRSWVRAVKEVMKKGMGKERVGGGE